MKRFLLTFVLFVAQTLRAQPAPPGTNAPGTNAWVAPTNATVTLEWSFPAALVTSDLSFEILKVTNLLNLNWVFFTNVLGSSALEYTNNGYCFFYATIPVTAWMGVFSIQPSNGMFGLGLPAYVTKIPDQVRSLYISESTRVSYTQTN